MLAQLTLTTHIQKPCKNVPKDAIGLLHFMQDLNTKKLSIKEKQLIRVSLQNWIGFDTNQGWK